MSLYNSPESGFTTAVAHYLFRVYHKPITDTRTDRLEVGEEFDDDNERIKPGIFKLNYNDYLRAVSPNTVDLVYEANTLAYAESLLYVNDEISYIAVWLVEEGKGIDRKSPICVFHPFNSHEFGGTALARTNPLDKFQGLESHLGDLYRQAMHYPAANPDAFFKSYDLVDGNTNNDYFDAFMALNVARNCETGPSKQLMFKGCVQAEDWFINPRGHICMNLSGSLYNTRFPYYNAALQALNSTHVGYSVLEDGRVEKGRVALSERIANGITDMSEQRRMALYNQGITQFLEKKWHELTRAISWYLYRIDKVGYMEVKQFTDPRYPLSPVSFPAVPYRDLMITVCHLMEFINTAAVLNGNDSLLCVWPDATEQDKIDEFNRIAWFGDNPGPNREVFALASDSKCGEILVAMADLVGACAAFLYDYHKAFNFAIDFVDTFGLGVRILYAEEFAKVCRAFSTKFVILQANLQAAYYLMFSWQFHYRPVRRTKSGANQKFGKTVHATPENRELNTQEWLSLSEGRDFPDLTGRASWDYPLFAPYRLWGVLVAPQTDGAAIIAAREETYFAAQAALAAVKAAEDLAAKNARRAARQAQIDAIIASIEAGEGQDPTDPYDWRNYTRKDFWLTPVKAEDVPRFLLNASNTPTALGAAASALQFSPKVQAAINRYEPVIAGVEELVYPHLVLRKTMKEVYTVSRVVNAVTGVVGSYTTSAVQNDLSTAYNGIAGAPPAYSPREMFPQDRPSTHTIEFATGATGFGGGDSGGGGAGATWVEQS